MTTGVVIAGRGDGRRDRLDPGTRDVEVDRVGPARGQVGIEDGLAERSRPAVGGGRDPESTVGDDDRDLGLDASRHPPTARPGSAWGRPGIPAAGCTHPVPAPRRSPRAARCRTTSPSRRPCRPGRRWSRGFSVPAATESVRSHGGSSGPASGSCRTIPSPERGREAHRLAAGPGGSLRGVSRLPGAGPRLRRCCRCGSVAVAVMIGSPAGAVNGTAKTAAAVGVGRLLERPQVVPGFPGAARAVAGAGEDVDAVGRVRLAAPQPALGLAVGGREHDREVLEVVRAVAGHGAILVTPSSPSRWPARYCRRSDWR